MLDTSGLVPGLLDSCVCRGSGWTLDTISKTPGAYLSVEEGGRINAFAPWRGESDSRRSRSAGRPRWRTWHGVGRRNPSRWRLRRRNQLRRAGPCDLAGPIRSLREILRVLDQRLVAVGVLGAEPEQPAPRHDGRVVHG